MFLVLNNLIQEYDQYSSTRIQNGTFAEYDSAIWNQIDAVTTKYTKFN